MQTKAPKTSEQPIWIQKLAEKMLIFWKKINTPKENIESYSGKYNLAHEQLFNLIWSEK
jgi:hypothetical protein